MFLSSNIVNQQIEKHSLEDKFDFFWYNFCRCKKDAFLYGGLLKLYPISNGINNVTFENKSLFSVKLRVFLCGSRQVTAIITKDF